MWQNSSERNVIVPHEESSRIACFQLCTRALTLELSHAHRECSHRKAGYSVDETHLLSLTCSAHCATFWVNYGAPWILTVTSFHKQTTLSMRHLPGSVDFRTSEKGERDELPPRNCPEVLFTLKWNHKSPKTLKKTKQKQHYIYPGKKQAPQVQRWLKGDINGVELIFPEDKKICCIYYDWNTSANKDQAHCKDASDPKLSMSLCCNHFPTAKTQFCLKLSPGCVNSHGMFLCMFMTQNLRQTSVKLALCP